VSLRNKCYKQNYNAYNDRCAERAAEIRT